MRAFRRVLLATLLVVAPLAATAGRARAQDDDERYYEESAAPEEPESLPDDYGDALAPYGSWVDDDQYGWAWQPAVSIGWAPYVDGHWAWTPYGWTWVSAEPWAWTFHYGRWALLPTGWGWIPGSIWGPAWVDWFWGGGFVGWAPLPPFATSVVVIQNFVFVHDRDFCAHHLNGVVVNHHFLPDHVIHEWHRHDPGRARPPRLPHIERVSHHGVPHLDGRPPRTTAPRHFGSGRRGPGVREASTGMAPDPGRQHRLGAPAGFGRLGPGVATLGHPWDPGRTSRGSGIAAVRAPQSMVRARQLGARPAPPSFVVRRLPAWDGGRRVGGAGGPTRGPAGPAMHGGGAVPRAPLAFGGMRGGGVPAHGIHPVGPATLGGHGMASHGAMGLGGGAGIGSR